MVTSIVRRALFDRGRFSDNRQASVDKSSTSPEHDLALQASRLSLEHSPSSTTQASGETSNTQDTENIWDVGPDPLASPAPCYPLPYHGASTLDLSGFQPTFDFTAVLQPQLSRPGVYTHGESFGTTTMTSEFPTLPESPCFSPQIPQLYDLEVYHGSLFLGNII
jgi:hypothetical protein